MTTEPRELTEDVRFDDLLEVVGRGDDLLDGAIARLQAEESGGATNWFKHGQFGSHNSFVE